MHTFFINDLIQLRVYCLRHVSNSQVFILRKTGSLGQYDKDQTASTDV